MKIKHIDTPYWLRNRRDTVQNPNRKRKFAGITAEYEEFNRSVSEEIVDHNGNAILDSDDEMILAARSELQYRVLVNEFSLILDSDEDEIVDSSGQPINSKSINKQLLI